MSPRVEWGKPLSEIPPSAWQALVAPSDSPFMEWEWLALLERRGCVGGESGWHPYHLLVYEGETLVGAAPLYLKEHSWGEFVFDQEWARVAQLLGLQYYPKLLGMSPFTPAGNYRFLTVPGRERELVPIMVSAIDSFCEKKQILGCHFLHVDPAFAQLLETFGFGVWEHHALVWQNQGYEDFDAFLLNLPGKHRKNIKRERRELAASGIETRVISGTEADLSLYRRMYAYYAMTCLKYWGGSRYLSESFFSGLAECFAERLQFVAAYGEDSSKPLALSMLVHKNDQLYGRYWGAAGELPFLHFEVCYYRPVEWAVDHGVRFFDAGSGSADRKRRRGFPATPKQSLHKFYNPLMQRVWHENIETLNQAERRVIEQINRTSPR